MFYCDTKIGVKNAIKGKYMNRIDSAKNEKIKYACKIASSSSMRKKEKVFFLEGLRLCRDAALTGTVIKAAFFAKKAFEKDEISVNIIAENAREAYFVSDAVAEKMSLTENSQGFYCLCEITGELSEKDIDFSGRYIALQNVRDPSNLGAICRTGEALGISGAIVSGCCDIWGPKSQRAAMGSLLRLPVIETENLKETLLFLKDNGMKLYATTPDENAENITKEGLGKAAVCVIGNEANGVTDEIFSVCKKLTIPMKGRAESLNASMAAAITMWEMMR